ncbi:MAG: DUF364 domain-containing protein [Candidatus Parcubacteria bacterium]|nr:DUF364 domain-containing protein [Candidatus Parcubacteria bacterium]
MDEILNKTLDFIKKQTDLQNIYIKEFFIRANFTFVKLSNGQIGTAGNYDVQGNHDRQFKYDPVREEQGIYKLIKKDPLLINYFKVITSGFQRSLYLALISALSQPLLKKNFLLKFSFKSTEIESGKSWGERLLPLIDVKDTVTLIGFGGGLLAFLQKNVKKLFISDLMFKYKEKLLKKYFEIKKLMKTYNYTGEINFSDGHKNEEIIKQSDLVFITGSALSNGTMEDLLKFSKNCSKIIIQGPSVSIFPIELFKRGATDIFTNIKNERDIKFYKEIGGKTEDDSNYIHIFL